MLTQKQLNDFKNCNNCINCSMPDAKNKEGWNITVIKCIKKVSDLFNNCYYVLQSKKDNKYLYWIDNQTIGFTNVLQDAEFFIDIETLEEASKLVRCKEYNIKQIKIIDIGYL